MVVVSQIEETMHYAMAYNHEVNLTLWMDDCQQEMKAHIHYINNIRNQIHVVDVYDKVHYIGFDDIKNIEVKD